MFLLSKASQHPWLAALRVYTKAPALRMFFLGFSSGLPLLLVLGTLSFWLREAGIELSTIGMVTWVGLAYGFKWLWAPLVDKLRIPFLTSLMGRRRSWLLFSQCVVLCSLLAMGFTDPQKNLSLMIGFTVLTAFASATQDIALDAYRIESADLSEQAALAATYQTGYRLAMIWAGPEPRNNVRETTSEQTVKHRLECQQKHPHWSERMVNLYVWFYEAACMPFMDFFIRFRWHAVIVLCLIATYRISDVVMGVMANPFYQDLGFTKEEVAAVSKVFGVVMTLAGAFLGGLISARVGVMKTLFLGGLLSALTNLLFSWLATQGHHLPYLVLTVSADNLAAGIASVAFLAYLSGLTNVAYTATQYALFSSIMLLLPKFLAGFSGFVVESVGYNLFFIGTAVIGIPVLILVVWAGQINNKR